MSRHDAMERLSGDAAANGYHLAYRSPFEPGACHSVGLTPHGTTGWSGRPDHQALAPSYDSVIAAARVLLRELQGAGTDGPFRVVDWRNLRGPISDDGAGDAAKMRAHAEGVAADQILHRGRGGVSIAPALGFFLPRRVLRRRSST